MASEVKRYGDGGDRLDECDHGRFVTAQSYFSMKGSLDTQVATLERQLSDLRAALDGKWISVETRLPDCPYEVAERYRYSADVLIATEDGIFIGSHCLGEGWSEQSGSRAVGVTHWQPLPTAPKEAS